MHNQVCQTQTYSSSYSSHYTFLSTLLQPGRCSSSLASFKAPSFSLTYPFYTAPFHFICLLLQALGFSQSIAGSWSSSPQPPCCTVTCILQNVNQLSIFLEADFRCRTNAQVGAHLSIGNCCEDALPNTSASNRNPCRQLEPWRAHALAAIMHQSLQPPALLLSVQPVGRNGSMPDNHIFIWLHRGITSSLSSHPRPLLTRLRTACTPTAFLTPPGRSL